MKKLLSILMALTMIVAPFGTNTCMASNYEENISIVECSDADENKVVASIETTDSEPTDKTEQSETIVESKSSKKSGYKMLIIAGIVAIVGAGVYALDKLGAFNSVNEFIGAKKDLAIEYMSKIPGVKTTYEKTKNFVVTTKTTIKDKVLTFKHVKADEVVAD